MTPKLPMIRYPFRTLPALAEHAARRVPDRVFIRWIDPERPDAPPRALTFAGFRAGIARAAAFLRAAGVGPGPSPVRAPHERATVAGSGRDSPRAKG